MICNVTVKLTMILLIIFGFFAKFHSPEDISVTRDKLQKFELHQAAIGNATDITHTIESIYFHACHIGHSGCFFRASSEYCNFTEVIENNSTGYIVQLNYLSPDLKKVDRPPIA